MNYLKFRKCTAVELEISNNFADNLHALMHTRKIGRRDLCDALNINYNSFNRIMIGQQRVPISLILKCCEYFDMTINQLINRDSINVLELK